MTTKRRFEMVEGSSSKFWEVSVDGASFTVTYGRIGTAGTAKTTACGSAAAAQTEADKLIRDKTKKGYQEIGAGVVENWRPPAHVGTYKHVERFLNYKVTGFDPEADGEESEDGQRTLPALRDLDKRAFRIGITYDETAEQFGSRLEALLTDKKVGDLRALVIGQWFEEVCEEGPTELVEKLIEHGKTLRSLKGLFIGDVIQEECEISWLHQSDYGPMLRALPQLEELLVRGGEDLRFTNLDHPNLRSLTVQTGGLPAVALRDVLSAKLPELRELVLWLGVPSYGGDSSVDDLAPLLSGDRFAKLEHLGLQDSESADAIAIAVSKSPLLGRLKGLDLSMGTLSDDGARALLAAPATKNLRHLNIRHHYVSAGLVKELKGLGIEVNAADPKGEGGSADERYAEVTE